MLFFRNYLYWMLWGICLLILLFFYIKRQKPVRTFLLGSITGLTALFLLHFYGEGIGFAPTLCAANLLTSTFLGISGTILILLTHALTG
ncbi:MAG: pro-sigmaK processing inhibitor BofA family protein [Oscillospiraceae bacterium]|nr:pro-sigmaK processing inhibitor BofA family protein [Oscillospiraceae bacterium]